MNLARLKWAGALLLAIACGAAQAGPAAGTEREVAHLLDYVAQPGCQFNRNGTWYDGATAREHLRGKYDYLAKRNMAPTAEAFIERGASASSMSGTPYLVRCGSGAAGPSGPWLLDELKRFRGGAKKPGA